MATLSSGFVLALFLFGFTRLFNARFPLDMVSPFMLMVPLAGYAFGPVWPRFLMKAGRDSWIHFAVTLVFMGTTVFGSRISLHFLASTNYYPYPKPAGVYHHWVLLGLSLLTAFLMCGRWGHETSETLVETDPSSKNSLSPLGERVGVRGSGDAGSRERHRGYFVLGLALGLVSSYFSILYAGAAVVTALGAALGMRVVRSRWSLAAALIGAVALSAMAERMPRAFLTWRTGDYKVLESAWSPYYFLNFISFREDHCLGGVYSYLMLWQVCDDTSMLQKEQRAFHRAIGEGKSSALILGRTDGTTPLTLESRPGQFTRVTAVEIDPIVADRMKNKYGRYNQDVFKRPGFRAVAADWRNFIEKDTEKYDVIVLDGLGIRLVVQPLSNFFQEDFVYTRESFETLFNERLEKDGILALNWGSSLEFEAIPLVANMPDDVGIRIFWTTFNDYPFMGLPVFLIAASRDEAALERVAASLQGHSTFREVHPPYDRKIYRFGDDSPFLQRFIQPNLVAGLSPFPLLLLAAVIWVSRKSKLLDPRRVLAGVFWGLTLGYCAALLAARCSRLVAYEGAYPGGLYVGLSLLCGLLAGLAGARLPKGPWGLRNWLGAGIAALGISVGMTESAPWMLLLGTAAVGSGLGMFWPDDHGPRVQARLALVVGLFAAQATPFFFGYRSSGFLAAALFFALFLSRPGRLRAQSAVIRPTD